jgi:hypothetical protein
VQGFNFIPHKRTESRIRPLFGISVAYAAPREQVGTVTYVKSVLLAPEGKFEIMVFWFHR